MLPKIAFLAFRASSRHPKRNRPAGACILQRFPQTRPNDREVRRQTALILERLANIERMTNGSDSALGHYAESETLYKRLVEEFPER